MMRACECGCEGQTKGGAFIPGHDAKLKSKLFKAARDGDQEALAEIDRRNWMHLFDKSVAKRPEEPKRRSYSREALGIPDDGLPKNASRLDWSNWEEVHDDVVWDELTKRTVVVERNIRTRSGDYGALREEIVCRAVRVTHEDGTIELIDEYTGNVRTIRARDVVGTY